MRIAQIAPLFESVPPAKYGGTERVVSYLTEELVRSGHDVTLFATADSVTSARLVPGAPRALRTDPSCCDALCHHFVMHEAVFRRLDEFDLVHFHTDYLHFPLTRRQRMKNVTTLHGRLDIPDLLPLYSEYSELPVVSISHAQRKPLPWVNWKAMIHHGIPRDLYRFSPGPGKHFAFIGRVSPEKGLERAIQIAQRVGLPLMVAAKVDKADREYFEAKIRPLLASPSVEFVGELNDKQKNDLLGGAAALLFPINWPEPFGMVMIESMACGTPVIAFRAGSVPEVVDPGVTGFIVDGVDEAVAACARLSEINRKLCRQRFEQRFSADRMAREYLELYRRLCLKGASHSEIWEEARL